ncbi:uncharacterized protein LOC123193621 isoform X2 [Mangifera indica]|uniref:uncharacterized protein LOC123193621 isoform X2 n=1 Tax=Mangifera indica TaxID=29780 RepID=UPI001CFA1CBD|nr:uncharacterized protein LOC123193621 isoform X2 [Mangifera indica]
MGSQKICLLLIVFFMYLYMFAAASTPLRNKAFPSESNKFAHGSSSGGAHARGGPSDFGEHGSNGGSGAPYAQGGSTVIPIYAGGAASNRHPNMHHNAGSRNQNSTGFLTLILTALAWLVHLYGA